MDVLIFEEHSSVLPELWGRGAGGRTLICLDAHLDLQAICNERLARLKACASKEQVKALEKPHHMLPDRGYAYSLEDWLYPAHRLQLFDRLVWVVPPHVTVDLSPPVLTHLRQMDGVTDAEIQSFRALPSGGFAGALAGVDIKICSYRHLEELAWSGRCVIDIDTDYFIAVPGDHAWVNPREVFDALERLPLSPECITISRSVGSGFLPLQHRFLADYLAALWQHRAADADHYARLFAIDTAWCRSASDAVANALEQELLDFPECPATCYLRSLLEPTREESIEYRRKAARLCEGYRSNVVRDACAYPQRALPLERRAVREFERRLSEESNVERRALAQAALGFIYCMAGREESAMEQHRQCAAHLGTHPGLALEIGKTLLSAGRSQSATGFLREALADDKSRTSACVLLAQIYRDSGDLQQSLRYADVAVSAAPAWIEARRLRADIASMLKRNRM